MRAFLLIGALVIIVTMAEAYLAYRNAFITATVPEMILHFTDEVSSDLIAQTSHGAVAGTRHPNGAIQFASIPFGLPPVGDLRFAAPEPARNWSGTLDATWLGPRCMQKDEPKLLGVWGGGQSEDCLWLSVATPGLDAERRPVIVWIHGGGFHAGGAAESTYNGAFIAAQGDVVVVNIQYRLGIWGWLDVSHLGDDQVAHSAHNGQRDQLLALRWIRDNIADFGGDPENITLMGASAGAYAVASLIQHPEADPLFHKAILMSGVFTPGSSSITRRAVTDRVMDSVGVETLEGLRSLTSAEMLDAQIALSDYAIESGFPDLQALIEVAAPGREDFRRAGESGKPVLHGTTLHEYHMFTLMVPDEEGRELTLAKNLFGKVGLSEQDIDELVGILQRHLPDRAEQDLYVDALTAALMFYPHDAFGTALADNGAGVYRYLFDWTSTALPELGAFQKLDLPYLFGTMDTDAAKQYVGDDVPLQLSEDMMDAVTSFAHSGQPQVSGQPRWPQYTEQTRTMMKFGAPSQLVENPLPWMEEFGARFEAMLGSQQ